MKHRPWTPRHRRALRRLVRRRRVETWRCIGVCIVSVIVGVWAGVVYLSELVGSFW